MSILVTGAAGLVGGNVARILYERGQEPVGFDISRVGQESVLWDIRDKIDFVSGSVVDGNHLMRIARDRKIEGIIHCAGLVGSTVVAARPVDGARVNVEGTVNVLEVVRMLGLRRIVVCSSGSAPGPRTDVTKHVKEDDPIVPQSGLYPVFKYAMEGLCHNYWTLFGVSVIAARPSTGWGPGSFAQREKKETVHFLVSEAVGGRSVDLATGADNPIDYVYVKDVAEGLIKAFEAKSPKYDLYNIGHGDLLWPAQMIHVLRPLFPKLSFKVGPGVWPGWRAEGEPMQAEYLPTLRPPMDITRAKTDLGYNPHGLEKTIPDYVRWLKNREWVLPERM